MTDHPEHFGEEVPTAPCQSGPGTQVVRTAIRLPADLHERLLAEADARDVSVNWLVNRAVQRYLGPAEPNVEAIPGTGGICENCHKPMLEHGPMAECYPVLSGSQAGGSDG